MTHRVPGISLPPDWKSYPHKQPLIMIWIRVIMITNNEEVKMLNPPYQS